MSMSSQVLAYSVFKWLLVAFERREEPPEDDEERREISRVFPSMRESLLVRECISGDLLQILIGNNQTDSVGVDGEDRRRKFVRFIALLDILTMRHCFGGWRNGVKARVLGRRMYEERYRRELDESVEEKSFGTVRRNFYRVYLQRWQQYTARMRRMRDQIHDGVDYHQLVRWKHGVRCLSKRRNQYHVNQDTRSVMELSRTESIKLFQLQQSFNRWKKWLMKRMHAAAGIEYVAAKSTQIEDTVMANSTELEKAERSLLVWRRLVWKNKALRSAEWSLLLMRARRVLSYHFGVWYIAFIYRFRLEHAERKLKAKIVFRSKSRMFFAWRFMFERSIHLRDGGRGYDLPFDAMLDRIGTGRTLPERRSALLGQADKVRYFRFGSTLLRLRNRLCQARDGSRAFVKWREYNAVVAVAILIQKRWRGHRIRCSSSKYRNRIDYCRTYRIYYHSLLQGFLSKKSKRAVFRILLAHHTSCRSQRQRLMGLCKERQALDVMKNVLFLWKWRSSRFMQVALMFRETMAMRKFWSSLGRICADSVLTSASDHFATGRVLGTAIRTLKVRSELSLKHDAVERDYIWSVKSETLLRLLKWVKFDQCRRAVQSRCLAFLQLKLSRGFKLFRQILVGSSRQFKCYEEGKRHLLRTTAQSCFHHLRDQAKNASIARLAADLCFLRLAGPKGILHLRSHLSRMRFSKAALMRASLHHPRSRQQRYFINLQTSFYGHRKHARRMSHLAQTHHSYHHLRIYLSRLRRQAHSNVLRHLLDDVTAKPHKIEEKLLEGGAIYGGEGIRPRYILVSPMRCPLPEYYHEVVVRNRRGRKGTRQYFDIEALLKLSVSKDFWADDDPRHKSLLHVLTSRREVLFEMALRRLHRNAFSPHSTYRRALRVTVFERKWGTPPREQAMQHRLRKVRLRLHRDKLDAIYEWLMKRDLLLAVMTLRNHARLGRIAKTFIATTGLRGSMLSCLNYLLTHAKTRKTTRDSLFSWKARRRFLSQRIVLQVLKELVSLRCHDRAIHCVAKRKYIRYLVVKGFFNHLQWILRPRRKLRRIARKFHLRPVMANWLAETASSYEVYHVQKQICSRLKRECFLSWFRATLDHLKFRVLSEELQRRSSGRKVRGTFLLWIEAIEMKYIRQRCDAVRKRHATHLMRWAIKHWFRRCAMREAHYWSCTKAMLKSLFVHTSWIKHQLRCIDRAISYHDRLMEVTLFRKMLHKYRVKRRLMKRATHGHDYLILSGCSHTIRKWRHRTFFRIAYKKKALSLLQQQALGIGTFSGYYSELVITTSSTARRLGLIPKETLSHGHGHISYHERLIAALKIQIDSRRLKKALQHWSKYHNRERSKSTRIITNKCFHQWKVNVRSVSIQRLGMIARLRETLKRTSLAYAFKGLHTNVIMKKVSLVVDNFSSRRHLSYWHEKTSTRRKIRRMMGLLLSGHHYLVRRLYFRYWKALHGPAWRSQKVFFQETIFRRWRCCFVALRHYKIRLLSQVFDEWNGLVFGRLAARFNVRRGRRIAARLLTRIRQQRCSKLRVFFNRWAAKADVSLPGLRLKNTARSARVVSSNLRGNSAATSVDSTQNPTSNPNLTTREDLISKEALQSWHTQIKNARLDDSMTSSKKFAFQSVATYKELAASTVTRSLSAEETTTTLRGMRAPRPSIRVHRINFERTGYQHQDDSTETKHEEQETENDVWNNERAEESEDREMTIGDLV